MTKHGVIYLRQSKGKNGEDADTSLSIQTQERMCRAWAERNGVIVGADDVFSDWDVTGRTMARDGLDKALARVKSPGYGYFIVYLTDRFARKAWQGMHVLDELRTAGVKFVDASAGVQDDPFVQGIRLLVAQKYSDDLAVRVADALAEKARKGEWHGGHGPYGYTVGNDGRLSVYEPEGAVVRRVARLFLSGMGRQQIAATLRDDPSAPLRPTMRAWSAQQVGRMLRNVAYVGTLRAGGIDVPDAHPAILDEQTFAAVQTQLARLHRRRERHSESFLSGLVRCHCGAPMYLHHGKTAAGSPKADFRCRGCVSSPYGTRTAHPGRKALAAEMVEDAAHQLVLQVIDARVSPEEAFQRAHEAHQADVRAERNRIAAKRADLDARQRRLLDIYESGDLDAATYRERRQAIQGERADLDTAERALPPLPDLATLRSLDNALDDLERELAPHAPKGKPYLVPLWLIDEANASVRTLLTRWGVEVVVGDETIALEPAGAVSSVFPQASSSFDAE